MSMSFLRIDIQRTIRPHLSGRSSLDCQRTGRRRVGTMRIRELAKRSGVPARTVRYYADQRLIAPAARTEGGYRIFDDRALREIRFVKRGQRLGLSLAEIKPLLKAAEQGEPSKLLRAKLSKQLGRVDERSAGLSAIRH